MRYQPIYFELLSPKLTLSQVQTPFEIVVEIELNKRISREKNLALDLIDEPDEIEKDLSSRDVQFPCFKIEC